MQSRILSEIWSIRSGVLLTVSNVTRCTRRKEEHCALFFIALRAGWENSSTGLTHTKCMRISASQSALSSHTTQDVCEELPLSQPVCFLQATHSTDGWICMHFPEKVAVPITSTKSVWESLAWSHCVNRIMIFFLHPHEHKQRQRHFLFTRVYLWNMWRNIFFCWSPRPSENPECCRFWFRWDFKRHALTSQRGLKNIWIAFW